MDEKWDAFSAPTSIDSTQTRSSSDSRGPSRSQYNPPGWENYPLNLATYDPVFTDGEGYSDRLRILSHTLFCDFINLQVLDAPEHPPKTITRFDIRDLRYDEKYILGSDGFMFRAISIPQQHTLSPFSITEELMRKILTHHTIPPKFLDLLFGFGDKTRSSEEGSGFGICNTFSLENQDICYQLRYVENNNRSQGNPWSLRSTGVYHRFETTGGSSKSLWILLHPKENSRGQQRFEAAASKELESGDTVNNPIRLHLSIMSSYLDNWRWYLHDLGRAYLEAETLALASDIEDRADYTMTFNSLQSLRHLEEKLLPIPAIFRATIATVSALEEMNNNLLKVRPDLRLAETSHQLAALSSKLQGHLASVEIMHKRTRSVIKLVADGLNLRNQATAAGINQHLLTLTKDTVDDSATVRVVTLVTLIYLPASFISTFFGMDFFNFNQESSQIQVAKDFWVYIAATAPLTCATIAYWQYRTFQQRKRRELRRLNEQLHVV